MAVDTDGTAVAVAIVDGELHAFEDTCPHAGCSLAEGSLDGNTIVCPCHLARFDITTGAALEGPAPSGIGGLWLASGLSHQGLPQLPIGQCHICTGGYWPLYSAA